MKYQPDLVVVILVHNDFDESYKFLRGTYASNFMKLKIDNNTVYEIEPERIQIPWYTPVRESAMWRFLAYRQKIPYQYLKDLLLGNKQKPKYQANIQIDSIFANRVNNEVATNYIFKQMKESCDKKGARLLIVVNGIMEGVYRMIDKNESYKTGTLSLNVMAKNAAKQNDIPFIDLQGVFEADFKKNYKRFTFINDGHWNEYGHEVVANGIYRFIKNSSLGLER